MELASVAVFSALRKDKVDRHEGDQPGTAGDQVVDARSDRAQWVHGWATSDGGRLEGQKPSASITIKNTVERAVATPHWPSENALKIAV